MPHQIPPRRPLNTEDAALWARIAESVTPVRGRKVDAPIIKPFVSSAVETHITVQRPSTSLGTNGKPAQIPIIQRHNQTSLANTLDANWDTKLSKGIVRPDYVIDLHEHTAASAHARLDQGLAAAINQGARVVLLITGKARGAQAGGIDNPRLPPTTRGVIRASISDWLAGSSHNRYIAAIRNAHPRHGGAGALYLIMRRPR